MPQKTYSPTDKEVQAIREVVSDETLIAVVFPMREAYVMLISLQLAYHHPLTSDAMKSHWQALGKLIEPLVAVAYPAAAEMLARRWYTLDEVFAETQVDRINKEIEAIKAIIADETTLVEIDAQMNSLYLSSSALQLCNRHPAMNPLMLRWNNHLALEIVNIVKQGYPELETIMMLGFDTDYDVDAEDDEPAD